MIAIQPAQLWISVEIVYQIDSRLIIFIGKNPPHVRPPEAEDGGRMQVVLRIGIAMVMAMIGCPPEHALLRGRCGHEAHHKLKHTAGLEGTMRKVTVIAGTHEKHPHVKNRQAGNQIGPPESNEVDP